MAGKNVTVRLDPAEHSMLRGLPGKTDSEKLRNLIRSIGATDGLAGKIAAEVSKKLAILLARSLAESEAKNDQNFRRALDAFTSQLSPILSKIIANTTNTTR